MPEEKQDERNKYVAERGFEISQDAPTKETPFPYFVLSTMKKGLMASPIPFEGIQLRYNENTLDQNGGIPPTDPKKLVDVIFDYAKGRLRDEHPEAKDPIRVYVLDAAWKFTTDLLEQRVNELKEKHL